MSALVEAVDLRKYFPLRRGIIDFFLRRPLRYVRAVDGVTISILPGKTLGLVGESGCGKTTVGRLLLRLIEPTGGDIRFKGRSVLEMDGEDLREFRRRAQIVFQDPYESLNPRMTIADIVSEPLAVHEPDLSAEEIESSVSDMLERVELTPPESFLYRYPHELSGGQRQRVAIARAFILGPEFVVADEPVSMIDVSIRAGILDLMLKLQREVGTSYLYITHDIATARYVADRIAVMYLGKIVELAETDELIQNPLHPYARALIAAIPVPDPDVKREAIPIKGEVPSPVELPSGCRFSPRCLYAKDICKQAEPLLRDIRKDHLVACHLVS